ncbi:MULTISPECIES: hypothetical protein [unclassified Agarivorans]|uniref:hypothetical protein n=1 Tax=unclassified Agarivorans TaxID=2636026 RepID=UPI0026E1BB2C|nr:MULTISPECIES: hypothetical protein [unclassified Agarivorans]MDO6685221.1 hypothetical protein [Agarivorans sp. 3_MG-2023]MDO6715607.1 hypothetical protein [Agarivorans sp. 2_MG-2023]
MKKREFLAFYKKRYEAKNIGAGDWKFTVETEGDFGFFSVTPRLLKYPPMQSIEVGLSTSPSWFAELVGIIREDNELNWLLSDILRVRPENGEVLEEHLPQTIVMAQEWYKEQSKPEVMAAYLSRVYELKPFRNDVYYYSCVLKGDVDALETERVARENGTSKLPPVYTLQFLTNAVRLAKEYRSGERVCLIDF